MKSKRVSIILNVVLILVLLAAGSWFFLKYRKERSDLGKKYADVSSQLATYKKDPNAAAQAEVAKTVAAVNKLYALPTGEQPSVATVQDKSKLTGQPFFANAADGDITLIYSNAKLAILYRPSTNKIINVSSVTIQNQPAATPTP